MTTLPKQLQHQVGRAFDDVLLSPHRVVGVIETTQPSQIAAAVAS